VSYTSEISSCTFGSKSIILHETNHRPVTSLGKENSSWFNCHQKIWSPWRYTSMGNCWSSVSHLL